MSVPESDPELLRKRSDNDPKMAPQMAKQCPRPGKGPQMSPPSPPRCILVFSITRFRLLHDLWPGPQGIRKIRDLPFLAATLQFSVFHY